MEKNIIKNIVFDLGNTLLYLDKGYFYNELYKLEKHLRISIVQRYLEKNETEYKINTSQITIKELFRKLKKKFRLSIGYEDFVSIYTDIFWENSLMKKFVEAMHKGKKYNLFMLSNTDSAHFNFIIRNFPYISLIKKKILSYKIGMVKPSKKIYRYLITKYNLNPEITLFVDDIKENVLVAKSFGFKTIHYKNHRSFLKQFNSLIRNK